MKKPKLLVVGSMNMDLTVYDVPKIPNYGESVICRDYTYATGGKGANQAYAAALLGAEVAMVGRVGKDINGYKLEKNLKKAGVNTKYVIFDSQAKTGMAPIMVDKDGRYVSYVILGANNNLSPEDVKRALNSENFDMVIMQFEMPLETVYKTYELASAKGIPVFLDAGPAMNIPLERLKGIFAISPNEAETEALTGISVDREVDIEKAAEYLYKITESKYVILKLGSRGAYVYDGKKGKRYFPFKVKAIDSTGAGDTFNAALVSRLCQGFEMDSAVRFANAAAAICVSRKGAQISIPNEEEVKHFLRQIKADKYI